MRRSWLAASGFVGFWCLALSSAARADAPPTPLRLIPDQADVVVQVDHPRKLAQSYIHLDLWKGLYQLDAVRETLESTNYRRFLQLVAYLEKQLGMPWPELLDRLSGGGI